MKHTFIWLIWLSFLFNASAEVRTWTSTDGRTIEAEFLKGDDTSVTIKRGTKQFTLPLDKITEADQKYVKDKLAEMKKMDVSELGE